MKILCLNPYSNGLLSELKMANLLSPLQSCLNPYSNGLLSEIMVSFQAAPLAVLILILMDYSLRVGPNGNTSDHNGLNPYSNGLLSEVFFIISVLAVSCLNPYSNGLLSEYSKVGGYVNNISVLILILMDYSLRKIIY